MTKVPPSAAAKRRRDDDPQPGDRLSDLPDPLFHHILSFLPTRRSARTTVLSHRWRRLWASVPALHFSYDELRHSRRSMDDTTSKLADMIDHFIAVRDDDSSLLRFHLDITHRFSQLKHRLTDWINYAKSHDARDVMLCSSTVENPPLGILFDWPSLEALSLLLTRSFALPECICLSKLKSLSLKVWCCNWFSNESVVKLLSCCPVLEELNLHLPKSHGSLVEGGDLLDIMAPNLVRLTIINNTFNRSASYELRLTCPILEYFKLSSAKHMSQFQAHVPSLLEASIELYDLRSKNLKSFREIFQILINVTSLRIYLRKSKYPRFFLEDIKQLPTFHKLKKLEWSACFGNEDIMKAMIYFLQQSPNLRSLNLIQASYPYNQMSSYEDGASGTLPCKILDNLKVVSIKGLKDSKVKDDILNVLSKNVRTWEQVAIT